MFAISFPDEFVYLFLHEKFTLKQKVKNKTSKKFKKGISSVFTPVDLQCFSSNSQFNTAVTQQLNNKLKF